MNSVSILETFFTHLRSLTGNGSDIAQPYRLFASKYSKKEDSLFSS